MKNHFTAALCLCCTLIVARSYTQPIREPDWNRPNLFQLLPDTISTDIIRLINLLENLPGQYMNLELSDIASFNFQGNVIARDSKYGNRIESIVIRSENYPGAKLSFTKAIMDDGRIVYQCKIMSFTHGDLFELRQHAGNYYFIKKGFYEVVNE